MVILSVASLAILYTARCWVTAAARLETIRTEPVPKADDGTPT